MNIIAPVFAPQFRQPMPADLQDIIREKMMATAPARKRQDRPSQAGSGTVVTDHPTSQKAYQERLKIAGDVIEMFQDGMTHVRIGQHFGVAARTIQRILNEHGVPPRTGNALLAASQSKPITATDGRVFASRTDACEYSQITPRQLRRRVLSDGRLDVSKLEATA